MWPGTPGVQGITLYMVAPLRFRPIESVDPEPCPVLEGIEGWAGHCQPFDTQVRNVTLY